MWLCAGKLKRPAQSTMMRERRSFHVDYKGTLTSVEVARALAVGWWRARPGDRVFTVPLADGGEGTLAAIEAAGGWRRVEATVRDPLKRPIRAPWLTRDDGRAAVVEMAVASGLSVVAPRERDAMRATSAGTGDLVRAVLDAGIRDIVLGVGGSATTDGGAGLLEALGAAVGDGLESVDVTAVDARLGQTVLRVACDVTNPLLGPTGAAAVYGPQKGAAPTDIPALDARLSRWADALEAATGRHERCTPGAGAAGGIAFALLCLAARFASLQLQPGVDIVMEVAGFEDALRVADLVITGEGRIDAQTAFGKTALGVARRAQAVGVPCIAVGGSVTREGEAALAAVGARAVSASEPPLSPADAMAAGIAPLIAAGERLAWLRNQDRRTARKVRSV